MILKENIRQLMVVTEMVKLYLPQLDKRFIMRTDLAILQHLKYIPIRI
jgi:hypothetical protein